MNPRRAVAGMIVTCLQCSPVLAACTVPPDVLPIALPNAPAAQSTRIATDAVAGATWVISGTINRCTDSDIQSVEFATPDEMGVTERATIQMAIAGVAIRHGNEAIENNPTGWSLVGVPRIEVIDAQNTAPANNRLRITWSGVFLNLTAYQLSYTIFLLQK